jgi:hypothetical protein
MRGEQTREEGLSCKLTSLHMYEIMSWRDEMPFNLRTCDLLRIDYYESLELLERNLCTYFRSLPIYNITTVLTNIWRWTKALKPNKEVLLDFGYESDPIHKHEVVLIIRNKDWYFDTITQITTWDLEVFMEFPFIQLMQGDIYIYEHIYALLVARNYILDHLLHLPSISTLKRIALNRRQRKIFTDIVIITDHTCLRQSSSAKYYYRKRHEAIRFTKTTLDRLFFLLTSLATYRMLLYC